MTWKTVHELLSDRSVRFHGVQENFKDSTQGLFLFSHNKEECETSFTVKTQLFKENALEPPAFEENTKTRKISSFFSTKDKDEIGTP